MEGGRSRNGKRTVRLPRGWCCSPFKWDPKHQGTSMGWRTYRRRMSTPNNNRPGRSCDLRPRQRQPGSKFPTPARMSLPSRGRHVPRDWAARYSTTAVLIETFSRPRATPARSIGAQQAVSGPPRARALRHAYEAGGAQEGCLAAAPPQRLEESSESMKAPPITRQRKACRHTVLNWHLPRLLTRCRI